MKAVAVLSFLLFCVIAACSAAEAPAKETLKQSAASYWGYPYAYSAYSGYPYAAPHAYSAYAGYPYSAYPYAGYPYY